MKCDVCAGACCEEFIMPDNGSRDDASRWFALHGSSKVLAGYLVFECRCTRLSVDGRCSIYDTRPDICRRYMRGGIDCVETVQRRRIPEEYAEIREEGDPPAIHE